MPGTYTNLLYHIVFSTKGRRQLITEPIRDELYSYIGGIIRGQGGVLLEIGGIPDHVHLLTRFKPSISVSDMLQYIKGDSSRWLNQKIRGLHKFGWQDGYAAFTVSESKVPTVRSYIRNQEEHHRTTTFQEELITLLEKHGVEYDERYLWD